MSIIYDALAKKTVWMGPEADRWLDMGITTGTSSSIIEKDLIKS